MRTPRFRWSLRTAIASGAITGMLVLTALAPSAVAADATAPAGGGQALAQSAPAAAVESPGMNLLVTCGGMGCEGQGPAGTGCDADGVTVRSSSTLANYQLRYSDRCKALWARVQLSSGWTWTKELSIERWYGGVLRYRNIWQVSRGTGYDWTLMAGGMDDGRYRACFRDPATGQSSCTSWYTMQWV